MTIREHVDSIADFLSQKHLSDRFSRGALAQAFLASRAFVLNDLQAKGLPLPPSAWTTHAIAIEQGDNSAYGCWNIACDETIGTSRLPVPITNNYGKALIRLFFHDGTDVSYMTIPEYVSFRHSPYFKNHPVYIQEIRGGRLENVVGIPEALTVTGVFEDPRDWIGIKHCKDEDAVCRSVFDVEVGFEGQVATRAYEYIIRQARQGKIEAIDSSSDDDAG